MSANEQDELIKRMVDRFLGWRLPDDFQPDAGISFKPTYTGWQGKEMQHDPVGTNLFTATQAEAMIRYILSDEIAQHTTEAERRARIDEVSAAIHMKGKMLIHGEVIDDSLISGEHTDCVQVEILKIRMAALSASQQSSSPDGSAK